MNIDSNNRVPAAGSDNPRNNATGKVDTTNTNNQLNVKSSQNKAEQDKVDLSPEAKTLKHLETQIRASADIDHTRIAEIKRAIAEGSFEINVERIAERLLQQEDLLGN